MSKDTEVIKLSIREAIVDGYSEIEQLKDELHHWWARREGKLGPDSTVISMRVRDLCQDLEAVEAPDIASIPDEIAESRVSANLCVGSIRRDIRCRNAEAKLRLAVKALRRGGLGELAEKIKGDTLRLPMIFPTAYGRA
jgi:hypothetical protein